MPGNVTNFPGEMPMMQGPDQPSIPQADPSMGPFSNWESDPLFASKHQTPFNYEYEGEEKCAIINVAMDESGSMVQEQAFMRDRAVKKMVDYLSGNKHGFDKVFVCSNGFGNTPGGNMAADPDGYRHIGCSLGYNRTILEWSYYNEGRWEDGYSATVKSIINVPEVIEDVNLRTTCKTAALNMILVTDEDRDVTGQVTKEDVRKKLADTGYIYNIVVNVFIKNAAANIIGMRYNYNTTDYQRLMFPQIDPTTGTFRFYSGGDIPNEIFSAKTVNGAFNGEYEEEVDPNFLYKELMTNGHGHTIEDYGEIIEGTKGTIFSIRTLRKGYKGLEPMLTDAFANALVDVKVCEMTQCREPEVGGDPHITTWKNEHYEFHGQCDLVLAKDPEWAGMGLDVHIRTKIVRYWSYIQAVAIRIGEDILEVEGGTEMNKDPKFWINFEYLGELTTFGGFPVTMESNKIHRRSYTIDLDSQFKGKKIVIDLYREFVRVKLDGGLDTFGGTVGLLGDPRSGQLLARDGQTEFDDYIDFGNEWQVLPSDGTLFHAVSHPTFPERCVQPEDPDGERHRRLGESSITMEQAEKACSSLSDPLMIKDCVYDVLATQDLGMTGAF